MSNIFLTGATGYIGRHLLKELLVDENNYLSILVRPNSDKSCISNFINDVKIYEYTDFDSLYNIFYKEEVDLVIHLAGYVGSGLPFEEVNQNINGNILLATHLLEAMRLNGVKKIINTGSYWEFGDQFKEVPKTVYAIYKTTVRELLSKYIESFKFDGINLILYDVYGEKDNRGKIIPTLVRLEKGDEIQMTPGFQKLNFVHVQDVIEGYRKAAQLLLDNDAEYSNQTYHLRTDRLITLRELVQKIENIFGKRLNVDWGAKDYSKYQIMHPKLTGLVLAGWQPTIKIDQGLKRIYKSLSN